MNDDDVVVSGVRGREAVEELRRNHTQPTRKKRSAIGKEYRVLARNTEQALGCWLEQRAQRSGQRLEISGRFSTCVVAVSYSPTTCRLQYHWRCRA